MEKYLKSINEEKVIERKKELQLKKENGKPIGKLFGIEIALEDNISTKGIVTTAGSKMLKDYIPPFNAKVVEKILDEDGVIVGKESTKEFGVGESTDFSLGKLVKEEKASASIGVDTSGEIRNIAISNMLYGLKPTYGSISRYGVIGGSPSFEQVGIIAKGIEEIKDIFNAISGLDEKDSTSLKRKDIKAKDIDKVKIGVIEEYLEELDKDIQKEIDKSLKILKELGCSIEYISIPSVKYASSVYNILQSAEFSSNMGKFDGVLYGYRVKEYKDTEDFFKKNRTKGFSTDVKKKILFGNFVLSKDNYKNYYEKSQRIRTLLKTEVEEKFNDFDILLNPITGKDIKYTVLSNIVGTPAIGMPTKDENSGIQIMAKSFNEELLFKIAFFYEKELSTRIKVGEKDE